jgi:magnesium transporter
VVRRKQRQRQRPRRRTVPGTPPGTITVDPQAEASKLHILAYGRDDYTEKSVTQVSEIRQYLGRYPVVWVNVDGLGDLAMLMQLAELFELHPLAMEDVVNVHQRAKVEPFGNRTFLVSRMVRLGESLEPEQISLFVGPNFVVSFQEQAGWDCLESVRERIRRRVTRIREAGPGYLAYSLLDAVVDNFFPVLEAYGERLEDLEDRIIVAPDRSAIAEVHQVKRELLTIRRSIWPQREALNVLVRDEVPNFEHDTRIYLRDVYDHAVRIIDLVETYREICSDLMDLYLSSVSNRMNEVMRVLTVISTLFIPLTFIAGLYGMNFDPDSSPWNMPELRWYFGYPLCIALMVLISAAQFWFFWRKGWIFAGKWDGPVLPVDPGDRSVTGPS